MIDILTIIFYPMVQFHMNDMLVAIVVGRVALIIFYIVFTGVFRT